MSHFAPTAGAHAAVRGDRDNEFAIRRGVSWSCRAWPTRTHADIIRLSAAIVARRRTAARNPRGGAYRREAYGHARGTAFRSAGVRGEDCPHSPVDADTATARPLIGTRYKGQAHQDEQSLDEGVAR